MRITRNAKNGNNLLPCQLLAYDLPHSKSELPLEHRKWPVVIQWVLSVNTLKEQTDDQQNQLLALLFLPPKSLDSEYGGVNDDETHATGPSNISTRIPRFSVGFGGLVGFTGSYPMIRNSCVTFLPLFLAGTAVKELIILPVPGFQERIWTHIPSNSD